MLQIAAVVLLLVSGLWVLGKGELKATKTRTVAGPTVRLLGAGYCLLAALPILLEPFTGIVAAISLFLVASAAAIALTPPTEQPAKQAPATGASRGRQLVGEQCVACSSGILTDGEARPCPVCDEPLHRDCLGAHKKAAHPKAATSKTPKRRKKHAA